MPKLKNKDTESGCGHSVLIYDVFFYYNTPDSAHEGLAKYKELNKKKIWRMIKSAVSLPSKSGIWCAGLFCSRRFMNNVHETRLFWN